MLNDEICKLRKQLNESIEQGDDYSVTYQLSVELDELIAQYYEELKDRKKKLVWTTSWIKTSWAFLCLRGLLTHEWLNFYRKPTNLKSVVFNIRMLFMRGIVTRNYEK